MCLLWYNEVVNHTLNTVNKYSPKQGRFPVFISDLIKISDPVMTFNHIMEEIRMNRSIQAEGTFAVMKYDRWYKRLVRRGQLNVELEIYLVSIGFNLHKFYTKQNRLQKAA